MNGVETLLWSTAPYLSLTTLIVVTIIRRVFFARTWTAKSSQFLEARTERVATPLFHIAVLFVFFGHVGGVLVPKFVTNSFGIDDHTYHLVAFGAGGVAGAALAIGVLMLLKRRFWGSARMRANTSRMDIALYVVLALTIATGLTATLLNANGAFDYRETIAPWFRGVLALQPDPELMAEVPLAFRLHMMCWMVLLALLPFTRLVHIFSGITAPIKYAARKAILYRRKAVDPRLAEDERAFEFAAPRKLER